MLLCYHISMTWSQKRQISYVVFLVAVVSLFVFLIISPSFNKPPSCVDTRQNGDETGMDCGGSCPNACASQVDHLSVIWARAFKVVPSRYNAVAYIVNHNKNVAIQKINYRFRFADANNVYIGKREGSTYILPGGNFAVFEPAIDIGHSIPVYTTFEFTQTENWLQVTQNKIDQLKVQVSNIDLVDPDTSPHLSATIKNNSLFTIPNVGIVAILYDNLGNAISASRTYVSELGPLGTHDLTFTWPEPISAKVVAKEIIPMYDIFSVKLK